MQSISRALILISVLALAACGSTGLGDLGSILGSPSPQTSSDVVATVNSVDTQAQRIDVTTSYVNNLRNTQSGQSIYYDSRTRVEYQGNTYAPADLERGDQISVKGYNNNGQYYAEVITVTRNARG
jgi:hypothetical protein